MGSFVSCSNEKEARTEKKLLEYNILSFVEVKYLNVLCIRLNSVGLVEAVLNSYTSLWNYDTFMLYDNYHYYSCTISISTSYFDFVGYIYWHGLLLIWNIGPVPHHTWALLNWNTWTCWEELVVSYWIKNQRSEFCNKHSIYHCVLVSL